jgi:hypothetical protein
MKIPKLPKLKINKRMFLEPVVLTALGASLIIDDKLKESQRGCSVSRTKMCLGCQFKSTCIWRII